MAHAVTSMVFNIYGTMSYSDRSSAPIEATLAYNNNISNPYSNLADFATLKRDKAAVLTAFFNTLLPKTVTLTPASSTVSKTVTDVVLLMTGTVTYDDRTSSSFVVEYLNGVTNFFPTNTTTDWADMIGFNKPLLTSVFEKLAGVGHASLT